MLLIFGKGKVGSAVAALCEYKGIPYEIKEDSDALTTFDQYEIIVPSPGIPSHHPIYKTGKVLAELDFAYQFLPKDFQIISVTGTDGKSTTSWIMYNILEKEYSVKKGVYLSGNFDIPFSGTILEILKKGQKKGIIVVEVSSFMSYAIKKFTSDYSICTNIKPDHLNWHADLEDYYSSKIRLLERTKKLSFLNQEVLEFRTQNSLNTPIPENIRIYSSQREIARSAGLKDWIEGGNIIISGRKKYNLRDTNFSGIHNAMNILSACLVSNALKVCSKRTRQYLREITGLPHRLEKIGEKNGIVFVEDSKSTSSQSLEAALGSYGDSKNLLLIVGGSDKGDTFDTLAPKFRLRAKALVCIGGTKDQFIKIASEEEIPYLSTDSLDEGVNWLFQQGKKGDVLMLSPGCASFGLFKDYFDRANKFREAIKKLSD